MLTPQVRHELLRRTSESLLPGQSTALNDDGCVSQMWSLSRHRARRGPFFVRTPRWRREAQRLGDRVGPEDAEERSETIGDSPRPGVAKLHQLQDVMAEERRQRVLAGMMGLDREVLRPCAGRA